MNSKISKNIPIPPKNRGVTRYRWDDMEVGDSFPVNKNTNAFQLCIQANRTRAPRVFEARMVKGLSRIWRTA